MHAFPGSVAAPTFDDPLAMLRACHGRITAQCDTLQRLIHHTAQAGNDEQAQQAARAILRYFDTAGQFHHQDEEFDLFPRLLDSGDTHAAALVARLLEEHKSMDAVWHALRPLLLAIAEDRAGILDAQIATQFISFYRAHIELENAQLLPLAASLLTPAQTQTLGRCMANRRGVQI